MVALLVLLMMFLVSGCTIQQTRIPITPQQQASFRIQPLPKTTDPTNGRTALFVNKETGVIRENFVFSGHQTERSLIQFGPDGSPELVEDPIGFFELDPAPGDGLNRERLAGPFVPGNTYSILILTNTVISGRTLDMQIVTFTMPDRPYQYRYWYENVFSQRVYMDVNMLVILPSVSNPGNMNNIQVNVNVSLALHKAMRRLMYGN